jgi:hypothetical protein
MASVSPGSSGSKNTNFTGVWQVNLEKSTLRGRPVKQLLVKIEHEDPKIVQRILVSYGNGSEESMMFTFETTGEEGINFLGSAAGRTKAHWEEAELVIESEVKAGERELHFRDHWFLSSDGQTLTMEHRDDDLVGQISVLEKAPPSAAVRFDKTEKYDSK